MIILPDSVKILEKDPKKIIFEVRPLYPGYGITLGNALRRILLSSIEGAAITQVKIKGASHEFSVLPGMKEDVLNMLLNLKQVRLKIVGNEPQKIELKASGEKEIKAADIKVPAQVEIVNKDQHIAYLSSSKNKLEIEMQVEKGLGYVDAEDLKEDKAPVGVIYLDAVFSPVKKVSFWIENIRFEKRTDYNKLKMEVETDGTVNPEWAIKEACKILIDHVGKINEAFTVKEEKNLKSDKDTQELTLENLNLSTRTLKAIKEGGIKNLSQLLKKKEEKLKEIKGLGEKGVSEIKKRLKKKGLELKQ
ncbi:MAG: DNA-directed RNA polymerase subunit alpha [Patescibacteria group bacterium]